MIEKFNNLSMKSQEGDNYVNRIFKNLVENEEDEEKRKAFEDYFIFTGLSKDTPLEKHPFFMEYLNRFDLPFEVAIPPDLEEDHDFSPYDWEILAKLIIASFSSKYTLNLDENWKKNPTEKIKVQLRIYVDYSDKNIDKTLDELWSFQIVRLFEIYLDEQINLSLLNDGDDKDELQSERKTRIERFMKRVQDILDEAADLRQQKAIDNFLDNKNQ